ncbi:transcriptional regulator [Actinophytocola sp.]|uniref:transcriptional regulator n=1 Tax=Actinophytocola sp. TaxID=1872138 RepID=UPI003D6A05AD
MTDDWAAVARAINERAAELGLRQRDLIDRSRLSKAVVGELSRNAKPRRRSARTLEALSTALDWHPQHLSAVLAGREPPALGEPVYRPGDVPARLAAIERQLREITDRLEELRSIRERLDDVDGLGERLDNINANLMSVSEKVGASFDRASR